MTKSWNNIQSAEVASVATCIVDAKKFENGQFHQNDPLEGKHEGKHV